MSPCESPEPAGVTRRAYTITLTNKTGTQQLGSANVTIPTDDRDRGPRGPTADASSPAATARPRRRTSHAAAAQPRAAQRRDRHRHDPRSADAVRRAAGTGRSAGQAVERLLRHSPATASTLTAGGSDRTTDARRAAAGCASSTQPAERREAPTPDPRRHVHARRARSSCTVEALDGRPATAVPDWFDGAIGDRRSSEGSPGQLVRPVERRRRRRRRSPTSAIDDLGQLQARATRRRSRLRRRRSRRRSDRRRGRSAATPASAARRSSTGHDANATLTGTLADRRPARRCLVARTADIEPGCAGYVPPRPHDCYEFAAHRRRGRRRSPCTYTKTAMKKAGGPSALADLLRRARARSRPRTGTASRSTTTDPTTDRADGLRRPAAELRATPGRRSRASWTAAPAAAAARRSRSSSRRASATRAAAERVSRRRGRLARPRQRRRRQPHDVEPREQRVALAPGASGERVERLERVERERASRAAAPPRARASSADVERLGGGARSRPSAPARRPPTWCRSGSSSASVGQPRRTARARARAPPRRGRRTARPRRAAPRRARRRSRPAAPRSARARPRAARPPPSARPARTCSRPSSAVANATPCSSAVPRQTCSARRSSGSASSRRPWSEQHLADVAVGEGAEVDVARAPARVAALRGRASTASSQRPARYAKPPMLLSTADSRSAAPWRRKISSARAE